MNISYKCEILTATLQVSDRAWRQITIAQRVPVGLGNAGSQETLLLSTRGHSRSVRCCDIGFAEGGCGAVAMCLVECIATFCCAPLSNVCSSSKLQVLGLSISPQ